MNDLLTFVGGNALSAAMLFGVALGVQRFVRHPGIRHAAWLLVLLRLLIPPILSVPVRGPDALAPPTGVSADPIRTPVPSFATAALSEVPAPMTRDASLGTLPSSRSIRVPRARLLPALALLEGAGALLLLALAATRWIRFRRRLRQARPAPRELAGRVAALATDLGLRRAPRVLVTGERVSPLLIPLPRATIVLPGALLERLSADETSALLVHELAHVRRHDAWIRPLETLATALYWWFPLLHAVRRYLRAAEEAACDALVVGTHPRLRRAYADGLLKTIEFVSFAPSPPALATGAADSRNLKERLMHILEPTATPSLPRPLRRLLVGAGLATVCLTPGWTLSSAAVEEPTAPPAPEAIPPLPPVPAIFDRDAPDPQAELAFRRAQLEFHRQLADLRRQQEEMNRSAGKLQQEQHLKELQARLEMLSQSGDIEAAKQARQDLEKAQQRLKIQFEALTREGERRAKAEALEIRMAELELSHEEQMLEGDEEGARKAELEMVKLQQAQRELDLQRLKQELERAEAELDFQRQEYERMAKELEAGRTAE